MSVNINYELGETIMPPRHSCKAQLQVIEEATVLSDYQEIMLQESMQNITIGTIPRFIQVILQDDLVDYSRAGEDIIVCGVLYNRWKTPYVGARCHLNMIIRAGSITFKNNRKNVFANSEELTTEFANYWDKFKSNPITGRDNIIRSICPNIYGNYWIKIALLLSLIGGVGTPQANGESGRSDIHCLFIGDPGTGKSEYLRFAAQCILRSVETTGVGTTNAGLTCSAVKESGQWMLEAGALVLADRGLCCIDNFDKIKSQDRTTMHEAMEQQTISVAKAGLVTVLKTRCTILAGMNPLTSFTARESIEEYTHISSTLLSRFDFILLLPDLHDTKYDEEVCKHIFRSYKITKTPKRWSILRLQSYIMTVKDIKPKISEDAEIILSTYYELLRKQGGSRITTRFIESLIRISQAHARLMFRDRVELVDSIITVFLMEISSGTILGYSLYDNFPMNAELSYQIMEKDVLFKLGLNNSVKPTEFSQNPGGFHGQITPSNFAKNKEEIVLNDDVHMSQILDLLCNSNTKKKLTQNNNTLKSDNVINNVNESIKNHYLENVSKNDQSANKNPQVNEHTEQLRNLIHLNSTNITEPDNKIDTNPTLVDSKSDNDVNYFVNSDTPVRESKSHRKKFNINLPSTTVDNPKDNNNSRLESTNNIRSSNGGSQSSITQPFCKQKSISPLGIPQSSLHDLSHNSSQHIINPLVTRENSTIIKPNVSDIKSTDGNTNENTTWNFNSANNNGNINEVNNTGNVPVPKDTINAHFSNQSNNVNNHLNSSLDINNNGNASNNFSNTNNNVPSNSIDINNSNNINNSSNLNNLNSTIIPTTTNIRPTSSFPSPGIFLSHTNPEIQSNSDGKSTRIKSNENPIVPPLEQKSELELLDDLFDISDMTDISDCAPGQQQVIGYPKQTPHMDNPNKITSPNSFIDTIIEKPINVNSTPKLPDHQSSVDRNHQHLTSEKQNAVCDNLFTSAAEILTMFDNGILDPPGTTNKTANNNSVMNQSNMSYPLPHEVNPILKGNTITSNNRQMHSSNDDFSIKVDYLPSNYQSNSYATQNSSEICNNNNVTNRVIQPIMTNNNKKIHNSTIPAPANNSIRSSSFSTAKEVIANRGREAQAVEQQTKPNIHFFDPNMSQNFSDILDNLDSPGFCPMNPTLSQASTPINNNCQLSNDSFLSATDDVSLPSDQLFANYNEYNSKLSKEQFAGEFSMTFIENQKRKKDMSELTTPPHKSMKVSNSHTDNPSNEDNTILDEIDRVIDDIFSD